MKAKLSCVFVTHQTFGLRADTQVLTQAVRQARPGSTCYTLFVGDDVRDNYATSINLPEQVRAGAPHDVVFLIERAYGNAPFFDPAFARRVVAVPNVEWILPADEGVLRSGAVHHVLAKTAFSREVIERSGVLPPGIPTTVVGWTSLDRGPAAPEMDYGACLHLRGLSVQKGSEAVVAAWLGDAELPPLTMASSPPYRLPIPVPLSAAPNLTLHLRLMDDAEIVALQRRHGIHVCPSLVEGFGHALNEARSLGAVLVTTDGPPMNEFVEDGISGVLVPVRTANVKDHRRSRSFAVEPDDLAAAIRTVARMPLSERREMGRRARQAFEEGRRRFNEAVAEFLDHL